MNNKLSGEITIYSKNLDTFSQAKNVIESSIRTYENQIREDRLTELNLDEDFIDPIKVIEEDLTTEEEAELQALAEQQPEPEPTPAPEPDIPPLVRGPKPKGYNPKVDGPRPLIPNPKLAQKE